VIHCREAWADLCDIIEAHGHDLPRGGILHCFTGSRKDAFHFVDCGFMVSFAGNLTFKNADSLRETASHIPLQNLLVETDSPYLAPAPHRGQRNEPAFVLEVVRTLATLHGLDHDKMAMQTFENFERFFRLL
jgi:TatD DNase family protein